MRRTQGMTFIGMLLTMAVVVCLGILMMRITPAYLLHYQITQALDGLTHIPKTEFSADPSTNAELLRSKLLAQLNIDGISEVGNDQIKIAPLNEHTMSVAVDYQLIKPLFFNMSLLFNFHDTKEVTVSDE